MIVYTATEIEYQHIHPGDDELVLRRAIAELRIVFTRRWPEYRATPYIVAQRRNTERQILDIRICAPADEVLERMARTGDTTWSVEQFIETP